MEKVMDRGKPESGKTYALTGAPGKKCIMNGNTWAESAVTDKELYPKNYECCKKSTYGCPNCLWAGCECKSGSMYKTEGMEGCQAYTYYD